MDAIIALCKKFDALKEKVLNEEKAKGKVAGKNRKPLIASESASKSKIDSMMKLIASDISEYLNPYNERLYIKTYVSNQSGYLRSAPLISISKNRKLHLSEKEMYISLSFAKDGVTIKYTEGYEKLQIENGLLPDDAKLILRKAADTYIKKSNLKAKNGFYRDSQGIDVLRKKISINDVNDNFLKDLSYIIKVYLTHDNDIFKFVDFIYSSSGDEKIIGEGEDIKTSATRRKGQSMFKDSLVKLWGKCSVTGCEEISVLRASHIKPWAISTPKEKIDQMNGLLLTPNYDALFDRFLISFDEKGRILVSDILSKEDLKLMSINTKAKLKLNNQQNKYMNYHRGRFFGD